MRVWACSSASRAPRSFTWLAWIEQQAHHDLKIVLHPVMDFLDQGGLHVHRLAQAAVAILDAGRHLAHGVAQQLELHRRLRQVGADHIMAAAIGMRRCGADS